MVIIIDMNDSILAPVSPSTNLGTCDTKQVTCYFNRSLNQSESSWILIEIRPWALRLILWLDKCLSCGGGGGQIFFVWEREEKIFTTKKNMVDCYYSKLFVLSYKRISHPCLLPSDLQCFPVVRVYFSIPFSGLIIWLAWANQIWIQVSVCQFSRNFQRYCMALAS